MARASATMPQSDLEINLQSFCRHLRAENLSPRTSETYSESVFSPELAPKAELTAYPWKEDKDVMAKTIIQVREFLKTHQPAAAAR